jgi:Sulfotransferase family
LTPTMKVTLLVVKALEVSLVVAFTWGLIPIVWLGSLMFGRPPTMVHFRDQGIRYLRYAWTVDPTNPSLPSGGRIWLTLCIIEKFFTSRIAGMAWLLDQLLYGKQLRQVSVHGPFFVISGGRSGSTQLTRFLEQDPTLIAPNILMCMFPYLWLWKLAPVTLGRLVTKDKVREKIKSIMPPELVERHEIDPFLADTFDGAFLSHHYNASALLLGPTIGTIEFSLAECAPHNKLWMEEDYLRMIDEVARKTLLYNGKAHDNKARFYLKGHFLSVAPALAVKYPQCTVLTVVRDPLRRIQSGINYLRVNPPDPYFGPVPWEWLAKVVTEMECRYCEIEQEWFSNPQHHSSIRKCVVNFDDFVQDLPGTMTNVYQECMDRVPDHISTMQHPPRKRTNYMIDRSLEDLGVDQDALQRRLLGYIQWMETIKKNQRQQH